MTSGKMIFAAIVITVVFAVGQIFYKHMQNHRIQLKMYKIFKIFLYLWFLFHLWPLSNRYDNNVGLIHECHARKLG